MRSKDLPAPLPSPETIDFGALAKDYADGVIDLICVLGPTASGKTKYAVRLAHTLGNAEIISADSRQVYRGMDIGTGKDLADYLDIPYHLIDIADPGDGYNVFRFQQDFIEAYQDIRSRGAVPILCGGTGLYINSVTSGYAFEGEKHALSSKDERPSQDPRLPKSTYFIGTLVDRETRNARIDARLSARLNEGMIEEIRGLLEKVPAETLLAYGLEYKFVTLFVLGQLTREEMELQLATAIHQFAKRQMTWFRGMERSGARIHWTLV